MVKVGIHSFSIIEKRELKTTSTTGGDVADDDNDDVAFKERFQTKTPSISHIVILDVPHPLSLMIHSVSSILVVCFGEKKLLHYL